MLKNKFKNCKIISSKKFKIILTTLFFSPVFSFSQWTNNTSLNTPVCTEINNQKNFSIASDTKGGAFIVWSDSRNNILKSDIFAQRVNSNGYSLWTSQGIGVCTTIADQANPSTTEDGNGGVIIAWDDSTNGDRDIYAQKLDSLGNAKWTLNGVPIVIKPSKQKNVKIISDGSGGAIAVWEDSLAGFWDIYAQRISTNGVVMWATTGVPVCTAIMNQKNARLVTDGLGGAYIVWQDKRNGVDYDIYAQHLNASGTPLFVTDGIAICNAIDKQTNPKIVSDGLGGAIITWQDKRGGISYDVYAQRINSTGVTQWLSNGAAVCLADSSQTSIDITSDNISGAIITWRDKRNGLYHDIYAQKINLNGTVAWQLNGIRLTNAPLTQTNPNICGDGSGGAIIVWQDSTTANWDIKSQRISSSGIALWNVNGNIVSDAVNLQTNPKNIADGKGGCIYVWEDFRNGLNDDIYAQHFSANGIESISSEFYSDKKIITIYPNPINDYAIIQYKINDFNFDSLNGIIYDNSGNIIRTFNIVKNNYTFDVRNMANGIYYLKITDNDKIISSAKFIINKK